MSLSRRKFTKELKLAAVQQLEAGSSAAEVARAFEVNPNLLHRWRKEYRHGPRAAFPGMGKRRWDETKIAQLEAQCGPAGGGDRFFEGVLAETRRAADAAGTDWKTAIYRHIQGQIEKGSKMTVLRMCDLGHL